MAVVQQLLHEVAAGDRQLGVIVAVEAFAVRDAARVGQRQRMRFAGDEQLRPAPRALTAVRRSPSACPRFF